MTELEKILIFEERIKVLMAEERTNVRTDGEWTKDLLSYESTNLKLWDNCPSRCPNQEIETKSEDLEDSSIVQLNEPAESKGRRLVSASEDRQVKACSAGG